MNYLEKLQSIGLVFNYGENEEIVSISHVSDRNFVLHHQGVDKTFEQFSYVFKYFLGMKGRDVLSKQSFAFPIIMEILNSCEVQDLKYPSYEHLKAKFLESLFKIFRSGNDMDYIDANMVKQAYLDMIGNRDHKKYFTFSVAEHDFALYTEKGSCLLSALERLADHYSCEELESLIISNN